MNTQNSWTGALLAHALLPYEPWLSCDDCFDHSDTIVEDLLERNLPLPTNFRAHLIGCPACRDEIETLAELAAADGGLDPAEGQKKLEAQLQRSPE